MNKLFSKIAIAIASFAMAIGGISTVAAYSNKQNKPVYAEGNKVLATFDTDQVVNYAYKEWVKNDWKISWRGDYRCGFDFGKWKTFEEQGYSKYVDGTFVTGDRYGFVVASTKPLSYVGEIDFDASIIASNSKLYLTYSLDGESYSLLPLKSGAQGWEINYGKMSFEFNSIRRAYYAFVVVSRLQVPPSNESFQFKFVSNLYEVIDPTTERITVDGPQEVYVDEEIELTATLYNFNPSEINWECIDHSIISVTPNGNTAVIRGLKTGSASITVRANGSDGLVYTDPFVINTKQFIAKAKITSLTIEQNTVDSVVLRYIDYVGSVTIKLDSIDTNLINVIANDNSGYCILDIETKDIGGVITSFDVIVTDNVSENIKRESIITIQVTIPLHTAESEHLDSFPTTLTPVLLALSDHSHFVALDEYGYLVSVDNVEDAHVFYVDDEYSSGSSYIFKSSSCEFDATVTEEYEKFVIGDNPVDFSIYTGNEKYSGMLCTEGGYDYMYYNEEYDGIYLGRIDYIEELESEGTVSPSNVFYYYQADALEKGIYPKEKAVDLIEGESITIDTSLVYVDSLEYEIVSGASSVESVSIANIINYTETSVTITASEVRGTAVIRIKDANDSSVYTDITVNVKVNPHQVVESLDTITSLAYAYEKIDDNTYMISGSVSIHDLRKILNVNVPEGEYDTLSGYLIEELGRIP